MATYPPPPQAPNPVGPGRASGPRAGFWIRVAAAVIDNVILWIVPAIIIVIAAASGNKVIVWLGILVGAAFWIGYEIYFHGGATGQTLGKKAMGIRLIDFRTGGSIGYGRAFLRWIGRFFAFGVCYLGVLWMLWDDEKQCWHDKMANDVVVPVHAYPVK